MNNKLKKVDRILYLARKKWRLEQKRKNQENRSGIGQNETDPGKTSVSGL
jgi:hypothetical protein